MTEERSTADVERSEAEMLTSLAIEVWSTGEVSPEMGPETFVDRFGITWRPEGIRKFYNEHRTEIERLSDIMFDVLTDYALNHDLKVED